MSTVLRLALALAAVAWAVAHGFGARDFELVRPRLGIPEIVRPGESIRVELRDALPWDEGPAPRVRLLGPAPLELELLELERRGAVRTAVARLPEDLALGAYGIEVELHGRRHAHPKAVHVHARPDDFEDLTVVHLADLPTFLGDGRGDLLMRRIVEEVNLIAPDLVLISGDIAYVGSWDHFRAALEHFEAFDAPVVAGIGNHEYRGLAAFFTLFGPLHHVVDLDGWRIVTLDSGHGRDELTETQLAFLEAALSGSVGAPRQDADAAREELPAPVEGARVPLVQMHHPPFWTRKLHVHVDRLVELCALYGVPAVLTGHWHGDYVFDRSGTPRRDTPDFPGTKYIVTTAAGADLRPQTSDSELHHGYRLLRFHRRVLSDYTYDQDGDGVRHPCASIPVGQLTQWQYGPRTVAVKNELHEDLRRARVRLWIDEENAGLVPDVGTLEEVLLEGGRTRYTVRVDVPRESEVQVTLVEGEEMMRAFALLQLPLVYLPLCVYGLGVYGSDFDAWSGRLFLGLLVGLLALEALVGRRVARLAGTWAETAVGLAAALVAGVAYAPLHLGWWDEHATSQAAGVCALGLLAWSAARLAAAPRDRALAPREVAGALVLVGLVWSTAWLYPLLPLLALGVALGLGAAVRPRPRGGAALEARFGGFEAWAAVLLGVDLFLGLWDGRWIATWAAPLGLAFALAGLRVGGRQQGGGWIVIGALNFAAAALWRAWGPHPLHVMLAGFALGGLLHYVLGLGRVEAPARRLLRAPLGGFTVFWVLGVVLGLALYQNLAFAPWRLVLLLPALLPARHREPALPAA